MDERPRLRYETAVRLYGKRPWMARAVRECEDSGGHRWTDLVVVVPGPDGSEDVPMAVCARCTVRQCQAVVDVEVVGSYCILALDHDPRVHHRDRFNHWAEVTHPERVELTK